MSNAAPLQTLLLDAYLWDLTKDAAGNIAVASTPYSIAQDAASSLRTFIGECFYDTSIGITYFQSILGVLPPVALIKTEFVDAVLAVPGVLSAVCLLSSITDRTLTGQVQLGVVAGAIPTKAAFFPPPAVVPYSLNFSLTENSMYVTLGVI